MKVSKLGKKSYATSKYKTETLRYCQSLVTAFLVLKILILHPFLLSLCVLTQDDLRTQVNQNLHVNNFLKFLFPVQLIGQVRQICKPLFFRHGLLCLKLYLIFLTRHIDQVKDPVCHYKPRPNRYLKNKYDLGNAAFLFHFQ